MTLRTRVWIVAAVAVTMGSACDGGGGSSGGEGETDTAGGGSGDLGAVTEVAVQETMSPADFMGEVEGDATLQACWNRMTGLGFGGVTRAGRTSQAGVEVMWGHAVDGDSRPGALVRHCTGDDCVVAVQTYNAGKAAWVDCDGGTLEPRGVGWPILLKALDGHKFDAPTHVKQYALDLPEELPEVDISARHFYVVNAFGDLWGGGDVNLKGVVSAAKTAGVFDEAIEQSYVQLSRIDDILLGSHPFDVLVWFGQGVREEAKTGEVWKPIGMTANAGGFGDVLYDRDRMEELLFANPFRGPGIIFLAGCETMGDGNGGGTDAWDDNLPSILANGQRTVLGFRRCDDARLLKQATITFWEEYLDGGTIQDGVDAANATLAEAKSGMTLELDWLSDPEKTLQLGLDDFWQDYVGADDPGEVMIQANINVANICWDGGPDGDTYSEMEFFVSPWVNPLTWEGPFFEGTRVNEENDVDLSFKGSLTDLRPGAHFYFVVQGSFSPKMKGITVYADAQIDKITVDKEKPDEFTVLFRGAAKGTQYTNETGDTCQMQDTQLLSTTGELSKLQVKMAWTGAGDLVEQVK
ncbi:MAG: hypothetical protein ABIK09_06770 [Pseudomonadota bacterium]